MADNIYLKLAKIQNELKSPKDQKAKQYRYRNIEDINEAVKPIALKYGCAVVYTDDIVLREEMNLVLCESMCRLIDENNSISASAFSAINMKPQYMSIEQSFGAASSYARKYAACGLFAIDSSENDPDRTGGDKPKEQPKQEKSKDPLTEAKISLWNTILELKNNNKDDATLFYEHVMQQVGHDPTPERVLFQRNVLLTEMRAANDKPVE